jgi:hypothetical protein
MPPPSVTSFSDSLESNLYASDTVLQECEAVLAM